jgi:hypothetical protein
MSAPTTLKHPIIGDLAWSERYSSWERTDFPIPMFGGIDVAVSVYPEPAQTPESVIGDDIVAAAQAMLELGPEALNAITPHAWLNYREFKDAVGEDCPTIDRSENIWKYVQPLGLSFDRRDEDGLVYVSFECNCDWEIEHGLQLVLQRGIRWVKVGAFDGHLTDGDAYDKDLLDAWMDDPHAALPLRTREEMRATPKGRRG